MSLVERKPGRPDGRRMLDDKREEIIRATINRYYLTKNRPGISQLVRDIQTNCISTGLKPPHRRTIETRLQDIDLHKRAKRRGEAEIVVDEPETVAIEAPKKGKRSTKNTVGDQVSAF